MIYPIYDDTDRVRHVKLNHAAAVSVERPAYLSPGCASLGFPAYARLSLPHVEPVLSSVVACLPYLAMVLMLFWFTTNSKTTLTRGIMNKLNYKLGPHVFLDHAPTQYSCVERLMQLTERSRRQRFCSIADAWRLPSTISKDASSLEGPYAVAELGGGGGGCKCTPLWRLVVYFCVHNCTSPSNDYAAVACSNNNQAQLHTHVSVPY